MSDISTPNNGDSPSTKKKRAPRKPKVKHMRSAPWHIALQPMILKTSIAPLIINLIRSSQPPSVAELYNQFCVYTSAKVSRSVFNSWLKDLGIAFHQTTTFSLPGTPPPALGEGKAQPIEKLWPTQQETGYGPQAGGGVSPPDADDGDVQFANETPRDTAAISAQHSLAAASINADMPQSPSGIPTDQFVVTPALSKFLQ